VFFIGDFLIENPIWLAPMTGINDRPVRQLSRSLGAGQTVSEMIGVNAKQQKNKNHIFRMSHEDELPPVIVQLAGSDPNILAQAAKESVAAGADIIDLNLGCPAKTVLKKAAGSALLRDEKLVANIFRAVVAAVPSPVTVKIRTGWDINSRNGVKIAKMAQSLGLQSVAVHGRTRADLFNGNAEYETIAAIKDTVDIPVIANGDITDATEALNVLNSTGVDGLMIGRATLGDPWCVGRIATTLAGKVYPPTSKSDAKSVFMKLTSDLHAFYGAEIGVRMARKHIRWFLKKTESNDRVWNLIKYENDPERQIGHLSELDA